MRGLDDKDLKKFLDVAFEIKGNRRVLKADVREAFLGNFYKPAERKKCAVIWNFVFDAIEQDLGGLDAAKTPELRYVSCVLKRSGRAKT